ncbi:coiled-coil domain-containing protein 15 isoform X10 [Phacochoerus africanus]|uniref:coiled-coil domain-containing protein 15 isoform X10 n=1 Tax=Phacochoerus africanus TaxID=41426 RepID=UPI001FDA1772|nr:coiled-coil domain-containing protein 15 isoform X10 [Phacochoerus africanus]
MAPLKKPRNSTKLPLALNPLKSKDVLTVLAERNQAVVPVGAWVEPAPPGSTEVPAHTSAYMIEEELKEQLRKKQEALKHFQRQVKRRVNQQIRLRKKQQLQRSYEAAEKEGSIAMHSSAPAQLTPKRTSIFLNTLNAAIGSARLPPSQMLEDGIEDRENQNELFQQAQALSQTMKQARHRLASFKTVNEKNAPVFPDDRKKSLANQEKAICRKPAFAKINIGVRRELPFEVQQGLSTPVPYQKFMEDQEPDSEEFSSILIDKKGKENLSWGDQQDLLSEDKDIPFSRVQKANLKQPASLLKVRFKESYCDMTEKGREDFSLAGYQYLPPKFQDQAIIRDQNKYIKELSSFEKWEIERGIASGVPWCRNYGQASHNMTDERWRKELFLEHHEYILHEIQDPGSAREQSSYSGQQPSDRTAERWEEDLLLDGHHRLPPKLQREASSRRQVGDECQAGLNPEFQTLLALQSGVNQEEDKKERQKQYLRYRRLFMDIEREQVKEQQRQNEHRKKIEKIKKKKEQQRYAEEQRILRMNFHEEPYSGEKMSEILAQLQLEEIKGAKEKQQQKEKEYQRYVEALRAQIQEKMQLYDITLPPLCCCGPDFWDAHPDTCANNCIFYKNHRAYTRALHSVINSCDFPEGNSTLRVAIRNFASARRRTLKNL